jgi:hypothetical protein
MPTLVLSGRWPGRLPPAEARAWLLGELHALSDQPEVRAATFRVSTPASERWAPCCDWMLELDLAPEADRVVVTSRREWVEVLHDFRRLRMEPALAAIESAQISPQAPD